MQAVQVRYTIMDEYSARIVLVTFDDLVSALALSRGFADGGAAVRPRTGLGAVPPPEGSGYRDFDRGIGAPRAVPLAGPGSGGDAVFRGSVRDRSGARRRRDLWREPRGCPRGRFVRCGPREAQEGRGEVPRGPVSRPCPLARRRQPIRRDEAAVEAQGAESLVGELRERFEVHDILHVVFEQEIQGVVVARVVRVPQSDRVEPRKARGLFTPQNSDLGLDRLEAADESEAPQRMEQVEMDLVQRHPRKCLPEERDVEPCAVERDEEFRSSHRGGEVFEVVPLDKGAFPRAVKHPDDGDRIPADREARRLDVEEGDRMPEFAPRPPMVAW